MDKKYRKNTTLIAVILLCVSVFGCCILTVQKANWINSDMYNELEGAPAYFHACIEEYYEFGELRDLETVQDTENALDVIPSFYLAHLDMINRPYVSSDVGFHSILKNNKGETIAEYQPCIVFQKNVSDMKKRDVRVLVLGDEFAEEYSSLSDYKSDALSNFSEIFGYGRENAGISYNTLEVDGTCDDVFVYLKKLTWYDRIYHNTYGYIPADNQTKKGNMDFEEWFDYENDNYMISVDSVSYIKWNKTYNREAKDVCENGFYLMEKDPNDHFEVFDEGLFTSTVRITKEIKDYYSETDYTYSCAYVYHPLNIAVRELTPVYIAIMIFAAVAIIIMCIVMKKSYEKQQAAENNRRELTRGIAHELKTPLAITRGYVENWEYLPEEEKEEITQTMMSEMDHMNKMVTDLLELSHMEAGMKTVQWEEVDLYSLTSSILKRMKNIISERDLNVKLIPEDVENADDFVAEADLEMIRIAMSNFISNAVKYAEKEVTVTLSENNKKVRFEIENDGSTIDSNEIKRVWDEFYKSDSVNRSTIGSSGLGLAITKNIFILHNAEYGCNSENGKVKFFFEIKKEK
ncbi:MAG: HAMP domain-containing histidine kinase [Clostridia bacterium]|nr:HAMP domain-containing histidine kinase [Clostridia bacterium]